MNDYEYWLSCWTMNGEKRYIKVSKRDRFGQTEWIDMVITEEEIKIAIKKLKKLINTEE